MLITAPGTYVLTGDLICPTTAPNAIDIQPPSAGPVIVDLKGFSITGGGATTGVNILGGPNPYPITVRNGTIKSVSFGVWAESNQLANALSNITLANLNLFMVEPPADNSTGVLFGGWVENSTIRNCTINNATYGITDVLSPGGNLYSNITMTNVALPLNLDPAQASPTVVLERCEFGPPH